ncbi:MAG: HEPN domain-containing protein [Gammaproteobacteria bacterium]|nr:MAG: HEPN domain-containing protein [Gammaproteobacteria bacterium]
MKTSIEHLPASKRNEVETIVTVLREEFEKYVNTGKGDKDNGKIQKIILFGSHATGKWVKDPANGYVSDYDILVIVNKEKLVNEHKIWHVAEDRIGLNIQPPLNIIVHTLSEVNNAIHQGQYFFSDIRKQGIILFETDKRELSQPGNLTQAELKEIATQDYEHWFDSAVDFIKTFNFHLSEDMKKLAAFDLHQAAERFYSCLLLVLTNYKPSSHNLKLLNSLAISQDERITEVFPQDNKEHRACFQLLKKAYVDARYSKHYEINEKQLTWLAERVEMLKGITEELCKERIEGYGG